MAAGRVWGPGLKTYRVLLRRPSASHPGVNQEINLRRRRGPSRREPRVGRSGPGAPSSGRGPEGGRPAGPPAGSGGWRIPSVRPPTPPPAGAPLLPGGRIWEPKGGTEKARRLLGGCAGSPPGRRGAGAAAGGPRVRPGLARPGRGVVRPPCPSRAPPKPRGPRLERSRRRPCPGRGLGRFGRLAGTSPRVRHVPAPSRVRVRVSDVALAAVGPLPCPVGGVRRAALSWTRGAHRGAGCGPASSPCPARAASVSATAGSPCGRGSERPPSRRDTAPRASPVPGLADAYAVPPRPAGAVRDARPRAPSPSAARPSPGCRGSGTRAAGRDLLSHTEPVRGQGRGGRKGRDRCRGAGSPAWAASQDPGGATRADGDAAPTSPGAPESDLLLRHRVH